jgi:hypothetical protein
MELEIEHAPVSVTLIKPTSINTPFPHHARNYTEQEPDVPPPVYQPNEVARAILHACAHAERDIYVGSAARIMSALGKHAPRAADWIGENIMVPREFRDEPPRHPAGTLHRPNGNGKVYGDHPGFVHPVSVYTRASLHPVLTSAVTLFTLAAGAATLALVSQNSKSKHSMKNRLRRI